MKKLNFYLWLVVAVVGFSVFYSCEHKTYEPTELREVNFQDEVLPIFQTSCGISGCHDAGTAEKGYVYVDYASVMKSVVAGDPAKSEAYSAIIQKLGGYMPPANPLNEESRSLIRIWIEQGAQNTGLDRSDDTGAVCFERDVMPILASSCATSNCHDNITKRDGVDLSSYSAIMSNDELVRAGNPSNSELYEAILETGEDQMPPSPQPRLNSEQIATIYDWINEGAKNETCPDNCDENEFTFAQTIQKIVADNCVSCHSGSSPNGNVLLETYADIKLAADNGKLMNSLKAENGSSLMPPSSSLSDCQIQQFQNWISAGALNN